MPLPNLNSVTSVEEKRLFEEISHGKVVVREEDFSVSSLLLSPFIVYYGEGQGQDHLKGRFSNIGCLGYFVKDRK